MIERHHRNAIIVAGKRLQRSREDGGVEHVSRDHLDRKPARRQPARHLAEIGLDLLHEQVRPGRHHEGEAPRPATGELGGGHMWLEGISLDRLLDTADCVRPHAGAVVQHAIDRREADASLAGDVPERQRAVGVRLLHGLKASRGYLRCATHFEGRDAPKRQPDTGAVVSV